MSEARIIKKYPNRRLYDTAISSYITQEDVKRLVLDNVPIKVIDARTKVDITHNTLLQIILLQEENGPPIFTSEILQKMIRFYGSAMHNVMSHTFAQATTFIQEQQHFFKQGIEDPEQALVRKEGTDSNYNDSDFEKLQNQWKQTLDTAVASGELKANTEEKALSKMAQVQED